MALFDCASVREDNPRALAKPYNNLHAFAKFLTLSAINTLMKLE